MVVVLLFSWGIRGTAESLQIQGRRSVVFPEESPNFYRVGMMKDQKRLWLLVPLLITGIFFLPVQLRICQAAEAAGTAEEVVLKETKKEPVPSAEESESTLTTPLMIGIGAAVLVGGAVALGSGGGGGDSTPSVDLSPPTPDQLVGSWQASANQPGSGLTYTGTYQLFQGGALAYDLFVSDGEHLVGGGNWRLDVYTLSNHTDHGSLYRGDFTPGNISTLSLASNTGWSLTLTR